MGAPSTPKLPAARQTQEQRNAAMLLDAMRATGMSRSQRDARVDSVLGTITGTVPQTQAQRDAMIVAVTGAATGAVVGPDLPTESAQAKAAAAAPPKTPDVGSALMRGLGYAETQRRIRAGSGRQHMFSGAPRTLLGQ